MNMLSQEDFKNSPKNTIVLLNIFGRMISTSEGLDNHSEVFASALAGYETQYYENDDGLSAIFDICSTLLNRLHAINPKMMHVMFQIFINVQATKSIEESRRKSSI